MLNLKCRLKSIKQPCLEYCIKSCHRPNAAHSRLNQANIDFQVCQSRIHMFIISCVLFQWPIDCLDSDTGVDVREQLLLLVRHMAL